MTLLHGLMLAALVAGFLYWILGTKRSYVNILAYLWWCELGAIVAAGFCQLLVGHGFKVWYLGGAVLFGLMYKRQFDMPEEKRSE